MKRQLFIQLSTFICAMLLSKSLWSQNVKGKVIDALDLKPMSMVLVHNIHTDQKVYTDENGNFQISGGKDELIEISDFGYKTVRVRLFENSIKNLEIKLHIQPVEYDEVVVFQRNPNRKIDSIQTAEIFKRSLEFKKLDALETINHPLTAFSKSNRQKWAFQERYEKMEKEKFVEYTFNDEIIQKLTNLGSDSIQLYKNKFRPQYEWFEYWNHYQYYNYIIKTVEIFRRNIKYYQYQKD